MSHQLTFADSEFSSKRRQTRKEIFLSRMEQILPWQNMVEVIEPFYPKAGSGRRPYPLETMLRIHCMQHWYNLSDGAMEDALYEIASMRLFARLSLDSALPDRTTIMNFRHLLEQHQLARQLFKTINRWLAEAGVMMTQGTLVDATIIEAPSSTKNKEQQRDPEMHQTKKGNQWHCKSPCFSATNFLRSAVGCNSIYILQGLGCSVIHAVVLRYIPATICL